MNNIAIQEGIHIVTIFLPEETMEKILGRTSNSMTVVFDSATMEYDTCFAKDTTYSKDEMDMIVKEAKELVTLYFTGESDESG